MFRTTDAEPGEPRARIGRDAFAELDPDRLLGAGRGEDFLHLAIIAAGTLIERQFDAIVRGRLALGEGGGEVRVMTAPAMEGGARDIEEIGDIGFAEAMGAELAGLFGIERLVRIGVRVRLHWSADVRILWSGGGGGISLFLRRNREFFLFFELGRLGFSGIIP